MGILDKVFNRVGTFSLHPDVEVLTEHVIHKVPFQLRVKLTAGERKVKIDQLEVDMIWDEVIETRLENPMIPMIETNMQGLRSHIIHRQRTRNPFNIEPYGTFTTDLTFTTEKATRLKEQDSFHLKIHVSIPGQVDIRERKDIEVLNDLKTSSIMMAMVEKLGFHVRPRIWGDNKISGNQWVLYPSGGLYNTLDEVLITVTEQNDENLMVDLEFRMRENPDMADMGISRDIRYSQILSPDQVLDQDGNVAIGSLSNWIYSMIRQATLEFDEVLIVERR